LDDVMGAITERLWELTEERLTHTYSPIANERCTEERCCGSGKPPSGWRESEGAVYIVDGLCAEITDAWAEVVKWADIKPREAPTGWAPAPEFKDLLTRLHETRRPQPLSEVPAGLTERATTRGGVVLFDSPPTWQAFPSASSRSLIRFDGDHLLEQVACGQHRVTVSRQPGRRQKVEANLASTCGVNLRLAEEFMGALLEERPQSGEAANHRSTASEIAETRDWIRTTHPFPIDNLVHNLEARMKKLSRRRDELEVKCECMLEELSR
jgi:hypothetical protein